MCIRKIVIKTLLKIIFSFMLFNMVTLLYIFIKDRYIPVELTYLGCAEGRMDDSFSQSDYSKFKYLYRDLGYQMSSSLEDLVEWNVYNPNEVHFEVTQGKEMMYICSYCVPLKSYEYSPNRHTIGGRNENRATFFRDEYQEGICFFYETENINPGRMLLEAEYADMDGQLENIQLYIIFFLLVVTLGAAFWLYRISVRPGQ